MNLPKYKQSKLLSDSISSILNFFTMIKINWNDMSEYKCS